MRFLSYYKEYPVYKNGYYYTGNKLIISKRKSKRQCRKEFEKIWVACLKENEENGFTENADWNEIEKRTKIHRWIRRSPNYISRKSEDIGHGESYVIERKPGKLEYEEGI